MHSQSVSTEIPGTLPAKPDTPTGPPIHHGLNPRNVTHYQYNPKKGYLIVGFTSGEWVRYESPRAQEIFAAIVDCHWEPDTAKLFAAITDCKSWVEEAGK